MSDFRVERAVWARDEDTLRRIRTVVFVEGQDVYPDEEWDGLDAECDHVLVHAPDGEPVATGRITADGRVGRMAVLDTWRGKGLGMLVLQELIAIARERGHAEVVLSSQVYAIPFYERAGFVAHGDEYLDARIPHRTMTLKL